MVELQGRDTLIIFDVAGEEGQVMLNGGCSNEDIEISNHLAGPPQFPSDGDKLLHNSIE